MARILRRLRTAKAAINDETSGKRVRPCVSCGSNGSSSASGSFDHSNSCSGDSSASQISSVVSDCQSRANVHGPLCGGHVFGCFGSFREVNRGLVAGIVQNLRRFPQDTDGTGRRSYPRTTVQGGSGVVCLVYLPFFQAFSGDFGRHQEQYNGWTLRRSVFIGVSEAIAKSTCRLNASTRTTKTRTSSPTPNPLRR